MSCTGSNLIKAVCHEPPAGARILDAAERRALIVRDADAGIAWTSRAVAERCGVTQATAAADLAALVRAGELRIEGAGRARRYRRRNGR